MQAIREIIKITNNIVKFKRKVDFDAEEAEIIILPHKMPKSKNSEKLSSFFRKSPLVNSDIDFGRNKDLSRNIIL